MVLGDAEELRAVMSNLLDNAIKYTDAGGTVTAEVVRDGGKVRFTTRDTGRGIPPEALEHVFDRFYRVDKGRSREAGGTGLGLAIAKWIVDAHGGTITINSEVGHGTTVTVELEAGRGEEPAVRSQERDKEAGTENLEPEAGNPGVV
jgi:signal transduction histidine kinase